VVGVFRFSVATGGLHQQRGNEKKTDRGKGKFRPHEVARRSALHSKLDPVRRRKKFV
jgi:hypothetical protein